MEEQQSLRIICLQTYLTQHHYQSYSILKQHILERIRLGLVAREPISSNEIRASYPTLVILPECTGSWLYLMCIPMPQCFRRYFFHNSHTKQNRHVLFIFYTLLTHMRSYLKEIYRNYDSNRSWLGLIKRSWFSLFADQTHMIYKKLFRELSDETNCTIVAGSTFMFDDIYKKHFYNLSYVFEPNRYDSVCLQSGKQYPVSDEISFIDSYKKLPSIYSIPNTNVDIAVLICADSWMPQVYEQYKTIQLRSNRRFLFIIIALNIKEWNILWPGYDYAHGVPNDVDKEHVNMYTLANAWFHYAINRAMTALEQRKELLGYGVVCCQGILNIMNDIRAQGQSTIVLKRSVTDATRVQYDATTFDNEYILQCEF